MYVNEDEDTTVYKVVVNHEEQYSIWPADRENALGWKDAGKSGPKAGCLAYIKEVWTDMRPLSLRKKMEEMAENRAQSPSPDPAGIAHVELERNDLLNRLSKGDHPVELSLRPQRTAQAFKECIDRRYVHIRFTDTKGGTELGVTLDPNLSDWSHADFANRSGSVHLEGALTLDYTKCRCIADIEINTLTGKARLQPSDTQTTC